MKTIKNIMTLLFLLYSIEGITQESLIPYLSGQLYGLTDVSGKMIVQPQFEEVKYEAKGDFVAVKKDGLWGLMNTKAEYIVPPSMKSYSIYNAFLTKDNKVNGLLKILDTYANVEYYVHPKHPKKSYQVFKNERKVSQGKKRSYIEINDSKNEMLKVATRDGEINYIDTTGTLIFKNGYYNMQVVSKNLLAIENGDDVYAVMNRDGKILTPFNLKYYAIQKMPHPDYVILYNKKQDVNGQRSDEYSLLHKDGEMIFQGAKKIQAIEDQHVMLQDGKYSGLYFCNGQEVFKYPNCNLKYTYKDQSVFILQTESMKSGIVNLQGKLVVDTIYQTIEKDGNKGFVFSKKGERYGLMNKAYQVQFELDSLKISPSAIGQYGYYKVMKSRSYNYFWGLIDSLGNTMIPADYSRLNLGNKMKMAIVEKDRKKGVVDYSGKEIVPVKYDNIIMHRHQEYFDAVLDGQAMYYDFNGNVIKDLKGFFGSYRINTGQRSPMKAFKNGVEINLDNYKVFSNDDVKGGRIIFFGRPNERKSDRDYFNIIINDQEQEISPDGYGIPENYTYNKTGTNGGIKVAHIEDAIARKRLTRQGVIDFDGNWLIKPSQCILHMIGGELFTVAKEDLTTTLYNRKGKKISKKSYDFFERDSNEKILNSRITVGFITNKDEVIEGYKTLEKDDDLRTLNKKMDAFPDVKYLKGFIDVEGNEVIEVKYLLAEPFRNVYTTVTGIEDSKLYSDVIDLNGDAILHTDYSELKMTYADTTKFIFKSENKCGVITLDEEILFEGSYTDLKEVKQYFVAEKDSSSYLLLGGQEFRVGPLSKGLDIFKTGTEGIWGLELTEDLGDYKHKRHFCYFNEDGTFYGDFTEYFGEYKTDKIVFKGLLPNDYIGFQKEYNTKPFVIHLPSRNAFKD